MVETMLTVLPLKGLIMSSHFCDTRTSASREHICSPGNTASLDSLEVENGKSGIETTFMNREDNFPKL